MDASFPRGASDTMGKPLLPRSQTEPSQLPARRATVWFREAVHCREVPDMSDGELARGLGAVELTLLGIGACIGAGIFVLTGVEARIAGPAVTISFMLAAATSVFNGFCFSELSSRLPISGSSYLYVYCTFGQLPALIVVANLLMDYHVGAATTSRSLVTYLGNALSAFGVPVHPCLVGCKPFPSLPWISLSLGAPFVIGVVTLVVAGGSKTNATVNGIMTSLKLCIIVFVIVVGGQYVDVNNWTPFFADGGMASTLQAAATLNYAFIGFDVIANAAEECQNPQKDIPKAIIGALFACATLYIIMSFVLCGMQSYDDIDASAPVSVAFTSRGMTSLGTLINVGAGIGMFTGFIAGIYGQSRIYFALARDHLAPTSLKETKKSAVMCGALAALLATVLDVEQLASFLNIGVLLSYSFTAASVLIINACDQRSERGVVALAAALGILLSQGDQLWAPLPRLAALALVALMAWACLGRSYSCSPSGSFRCPGLPLTPLVALASNVFLAAQLSRNAWIRLAVVSAIVIGAHSLAHCCGWSDAQSQRGHIVTTVKTTVAQSGTETGLCRKEGT